VAKSTAPNGAPAVFDSDDRLGELFSSFSKLRNNNRVLVDQIRGSIGELRELRLKLRTQMPTSGPSRRTRGLDQDTLEQRFGLTRRQVEVAMRLAHGRSNQAIATELKISAHTARHHTQRILSKLGVHSRGEAGAKIRG
jgi:DNA-binding NarL/FixJ family response regulator